MNYASRLRTTSSSSPSVASPILRCLLVMILASTVVVVRLGTPIPTPPTATTTTNRQHHASSTEFALVGTATHPPFSHRGGSKLEQSSLQQLQQAQQQDQQSKNPLALSCATVEQRALSGAWYDPLRGQANLIRRVLDYPYYYISLHSRQYDVVRHKSLYVRGRYYERAVMQRFHTILGSNKNKNQQQPAQSQSGIVLDVGANVGVYTLLSAGLGHTVHAFEINPANLIRLCESLWINGFVVDSNDAQQIQQQVQIYQRGVSAQTGIPLRLVVPHNPGQAHLVPTTTTIRSNDDAATVVTVETLTLDDWAAAQGWLPPLHSTTTTTTPTLTPPNILLLKMDVEGVEPSVVAGAERLLRTGWIRNVLTEVKRMARPELQTMLRTLLDCGYVLMLDEDNANDEVTPARRLTRLESQVYLQRLQKQTRATWYRKDVTVDLWFQLVLGNDE